MKWSFVVREKLKIATLLSVVMLSIVVVNLLSNGNVKGIGRSVSSIYEDRLIPALELVYLVENMYTKRLLIERHLLKAGSHQTDSVKRAIALHDQQIDSLLISYNKSEQITAEKQDFSSLSALLLQYQQLENKTLSLWQQGEAAESKALFESRAQPLFDKIVSTLNRLVDIQSQVAKELIHDSKTDESALNLYAMLHILLSIAIGIIILVLVASSRTLPPQTNKEYPFHMN